jgi:predicted RNase H-like HicB family nuclease
MSRRHVPVLVWKEDKLYVAKSLGLELASQGKTKTEALKNLQEALDLLLEDEEVKTSDVKFPQDVAVGCIYA